MSDKSAPNRMISPIHSRARFRRLALNAFRLGSLVTLGGLTLGGCSDPLPPAPEAALETTIQFSAGCTSSRGPLSVGEDQAVLSSTNPGTNRVINGRGGNKVDCTVAKTQTGFTIEADLEVDTIEFYSGTTPYRQVFALAAAYPGYVRGGTTTASISGSVAQTETSRADSACSLSVISLGENDEGGALWATFDCPNYVDPQNPASVCSLVGTVVLENCAK